MTVEIPLNKGYVTFVDDEDADLADLKWRVCDHRRIRAVYAQTTVDRDGKETTEKLHRMILSRKLGRPLLRTERVDHKDEDGLNNRRENLRLATHSQNMMNIERVTRNTSGFRGVYFRKTDGKWFTRLTVNRKTYFLGSYATREEAIEARIAGEQEHFGEFAPSLRESAHV